MKTMQVSFETYKWLTGPKVQRLVGLLAKAKDCSMPTMRKLASAARIKHMAALEFHMKTMQRYGLIETKKRGITRAVALTATGKKYAAMLAEDAATAKTSAAHAKLGKKLVKAIKRDAKRMKK